MYDFIAVQAARNRTGEVAREARPNSPIRSDEPRRHPLRGRVSLMLFRVASWLEPASARETAHAGTPRVQQAGPGAHLCANPPATCR